MVGVTASGAVGGDAGLSVVGVTVGGAVGGVAGLSAAGVTVGHALIEELDSQISLQ